MEKYVDWPKVQGILVNPELKDMFFDCKLEDCKGACCTKGESGPVITRDEASILRKDHIYFLHQMEEEARLLTEENGPVDTVHGEMKVRILPNNGPCVFLSSAKEHDYCLLEEAWFERDYKLRKPLSCHLFPLLFLKNPSRLTYARTGYCESSFSGSKHIFDSCRPALLRLFGSEFLLELYSTFNLEL